MFWRRVFALMIVSVVAASAQSAAGQGSTKAATGTHTRKKAAATANSAAADSKPITRPKSFDMDAMDKSVNPCEDFYEYACGNWRKNNPIPSDQSRWGRFNELAERNRNNLHTILDSIKEPKPTRTPLEKQVGDYYAACMDESAIDKKGAAPLTAMFVKIDGIKTKADLFRMMGDRQEAMPSFFGFGGQPDVHNSSKIMAQVGQGGTTLPDRDDYLKDDAKSKEMREKYVQHITNMMKLAGESDSDAAATAKTVLTIETALAKAQLPRVAMRDPKNRDNPMSVDDLRKAYPNFDFTDFFVASGAPYFSRVNIVGKKFFDETNALVDSTSIDDWKTYMKWHATRGSAPLLSKPFVDEAFAFNGKFLSGAQEQEPRWKRCVASTDRALGEALGQIYVKK